MKDSFIRTAMLLGASAEIVLNNSHVCVFGIGGVGGNCIEALARSGVGHLHIVDADIISTSNLNRQAVATKSNIGNKKTSEMKTRIEDISDCRVTVSDVFVLPDNVHDTVPVHCDFIVDAIDTVSAKLSLAQYSKNNNIPIISCMGMGNRIDPTQIRIGDIYMVTGCPLARTMRHELKKRGILSLTVAYSLEMPMVPLFPGEATNKRQTPGSIAFVPSVAGLIMAGYVVRKLTEN